MSKMSELAATLEDLSRSVSALITGGENVLRAITDAKDLFSANENSSPAPQEPKDGQEAARSRTYTKEEVRAVLAGLSQNGFRNEAKELVRKYSNGESLTDIDPAKYPELVAEAEGYHA